MKRRGTGQNARCIHDTVGVRTSQRKSGAGQGTVAFGGDRRYHDLASGAEVGPHHNETEKMRTLSIIGLSSEIGRGHPSYLDSVWTLLERDCPDSASCLAYWTAFHTSVHTSVRTSRLAWSAVASVYWIGGRGGTTTRLYNILRRRRGAPSRGGLAVGLLGKDVRAALRGFEGICLVAHPILAQIASTVSRTWFIHGEIAAPEECAVSGVEKIFVPLDSTGRRLVKAGADPRAIVATGLVVEPDLASAVREAFQARLKRIESDEPLTIGFFTSGAYPREHMRKMAIAARSAVDRGMRAVLFCGTKPSAFRWLLAEAKRWGVPVIEDSARRGGVWQRDWSVILVQRKTRQAETERAIELVPVLDAFVAAAHERTNWAVGLGLPMWVLFPHIGTFAAENWEFATSRGVSRPVRTDAEARAFGTAIQAARADGDLALMARRGFGHLPIEGAHRIAELALGEISTTEVPRFRTT